MSTARFARKIRHHLRKHHHTKLFWRSWFYRCPKQFERLFQWFLTVAICVVVSAAIVRFATWAADPVETLLLVNAIGSIACVFLISKLRYYYDATDFPRLNTIALLPWTDRQWLYEFLRGTPGSLIPSICFSLITLCSAARLTVVTVDFKIGLAIAATAVQVLMIASLTLCVTSFSFKLLQSPRLSLWFGRIKIIAFVTIALLLYPPIAQQAVAWRLTDAIFLLPTAWPTAIFLASAGDLSITRASIGLFGCAVVAITIAAISIARLKTTFKVAEISFGPLGDGYLLCQDAWEVCQTRRDEWIAFEAKRSIAQTTNDPETDDLSDETMQSEAISYRNSLDVFWDNQGWLGRWFDADQRNVVAMQYLVLDSNRSPWQFFRYYTGLMVIAAVYFLIAPKYLPTTVAYAIPMLLASMALGIFGEATPPLAASYRSLPLLANQWLWPPVKFEYLRLIMLVPPAIILIMFTLVSTGHSYADTLKIVSITIVAPFAAIPTINLLMHSNATRDRFRILTILGAAIAVVPVVMVGIGGVVAQFALDWPVNLYCIPLIFIAISTFGKLICNWHDKGSVDHYVAPKN